jgi:DNA adenine methylase
MAAWVISHFPLGYEKMKYIEPYFGSGAVFFTKNRSQLETINDLDDDVVNLFSVVRNSPEELARAISFTPWSRTEYQQSYSRNDCEAVEKARRFLVRMWQGIGAKPSTSTGWRKNIKSVNGSIPRFSLGLPQSILEITDRPKHGNGNRIVQIDCKPATELIRRHNTEDTLIYADPPYVLDSSANRRIYKHEMTDADHRELLSLLLQHKGAVVISNYHNEIYDAILKDWPKAEKASRTESGSMKTEVIWWNYEPITQGKLWE